MPAEKFKVRIAGRTESGLIRDHNEDYIGFDESLAFAIVADGLGGRSSGEIASFMAVKTVMDGLRARPLADLDHTTSAITTSLRKTVELANRKIYEAAQATALNRTMSTTFVVGRISGPRLHACFVGDSRLYLLRQRELKQLSVDHSLINDLLAKGVAPKNGYSLANIDHILTRALGIRDDVEVDSLEFEMQEDDLLLLCSDGLWHMVADWQIKDTLNDCGDKLDQSVHQLIDHANRNGGKDNISAVLMQVL